MIGLIRLRKVNNIEYKKDKLKMKFLLYEIVHHCNLNCKGCDHCSPLAKEEFLSIEEYTNDLRQISKVFDEIRTIGIMGGEPLLHPEINEFIKITREIFPKIIIKIYTNGTLLFSKNEKFWDTLRQTNTIISATFYHQDKISEICEKCKKEKVTINTEHWYKQNKLLFKKVKFDLKGRQNKYISHRLCTIASACPSLEKGKLYKCTVICGARHFNDFFGTNMIVSQKDYIDIYKQNSKEEIYNYFKNTIEFCKYCNILGSSFYNWDLSKKDIKEWI